MGCNAALLEQLDTDELVIDPLMPRMEGNLPLFAQPEKFALRNLQNHQFQVSSEMTGWQTGAVLTVKTEKSLSLS